MADDEMSPSPPAPTDPRLPLSAMQVFKLKKSWKGIKRCLDDTGVEMFIRYFKGQATSRQLFRQFVTMTSDQLRVNEELERHAGKVMAVFDECVQNIEDVDETARILGRATVPHKGIRGFHFSMYLDFLQPFLEAVKITLGDRYSDNMDAIYKITIRYFLDTIVRRHQGGS